jgi:cytochrome b561
MNNNQYTKTAIFLHWFIGLAIFAMFALGWYMAELPKDAPKALSFDLFDLGLFNWQMAEEVSPRTFYFNLHKSIGVTLLALIVLRFVWRLTHRPPALLASMTAAQKNLSTAVHHLLYLLMFALPISGVAMAISSKYGLKWFGTELVAGLDNAACRDFYKEAHEVLGVVLLVLIIVHILAALKHQFIVKDETMSRMSPCKLWSNCCKKK